MFCALDWEEEGIAFRALAGRRSVVRALGWRKSVLWFVLWVRECGPCFVFIRNFILSLPVSLHWGDLILLLPVSLRWGDFKFLRTHHYLMNIRGHHLGGKWGRPGQIEIGFGRAERAGEPNVVVHRAGRRLSGGGDWVRFEVGLDLLGILASPLAYQNPISSYLWVLTNPMCIIR